MNSLRFIIIAFISVVLGFLLTLILPTIIVNLADFIKNILSAPKVIKDSVTIGVVVVLSLILYIILDKIFKKWS